MGSPTSPGSTAAATSSSVFERLVPQDHVTKIAQMEHQADRVQSCARLSEAVLDELQAFAKRRRPDGSQRPPEGTPAVTRASVDETLSRTRRCWELCGLSNPKAPSTDVPPELRSLRSLAARVERMALEVKWVLYDCM